MDRKEMAGRHIEVMSEAADRWERKSAEADTATTILAREGRLAATSESLGKVFLCREVQKTRPTDERFLFERKIGPSLDFVDFAPNDAAERAGRPVARIVELLSRDRIGDGFATGFLIAPGVLVTNWHVFAEERDSANCGVQFGYQRNRSGGIDPGVVFAIDAREFFFSDKSLDIAIVGISPTATVGRGALNDYGRTKFVPARGKYLVGNPINIIQHPDGLPKRWAVSENGLRIEPSDNDLFLHYLTDTLGGSSGSPAFNHDWELVAVHHCGVPRRVDGQIMAKNGEPWREGMPDDDIDWVANEGIRVSKICAFLAGLRLSNPSRQRTLTAILSDVAGSNGVSNETIHLGPESAFPTELGNKKALSQERTVNIVVNGTANIFIDKEDQRVVSAPISPPEQVAPGIGIEKKLRFDSDYVNRPGYFSEFLDGFDVPMPMAPSREVLKKGNSAFVLNYHHYSLVMHKERRLAMWTASNIDYSENTRRKTRKEFGTDTWKPDPRIPIEAQIEDLEFYEPAAKFDRGHLVRRDDVAWGNDEQEEEYSNSDSFHWTNCTPQHEGYNRDMFQYKGLWGQLENHITKQANFIGSKYILFAGPVLDDRDPVKDFGSGIGVKVPMVFWKVVIVIEKTNQDETLRAYGFLLDQTDAINDYGWEARFRVGKFKEQQVSLSEITDRTKVRFDDIVYGADPLANVLEEGKRRSLHSLDDVTFR
jgi:endonuclease G